MCYNIYMDVLEFISQYWAVILGVIAFIMSYTDLKSQNSSQEKRIEKLEKDSEALNPVLIEIRTKLASIEATLQMLTRK